MFSLVCFKVVVIFLDRKSKSPCLPSLRQPEELDKFREAPMRFWEEMLERERVIWIGS